MQKSTRSFPSSFRSCSGQGAFPKSRAFRKTISGQDSRRRIDPLPRSASPSCFRRLFLRAAYWQTAWRKSKSRVLYEGGSRCFLDGFRGRLPKTTLARSAHLPFRLIRMRQCTRRCQISTDCRLFDLAHSVVRLACFAGQQDSSRSKFTNVGRGPRSPI